LRKSFYAKPSLLEGSEQNEGKTMLCSKLKTLPALIGIILVTLAAPVKAVEYNVGVSVGQWVTYGNFVAIGPNAPSDLNETLWARMEVVEVFGKNVTLHMSGMYKNGTPAPESGTICNVETGWSNSSGMYGISMLIAANLQAGDALPGTPFTINKTETRNYGGFVTSVNILNLTFSMPGYYYKYVYVWDKPSGMLLELEFEMQTSTPPAYSKMAFSMTNTNIPEFPSNIILPLFMMSALIAILCLKKRVARQTKT